MWSKEHQEQPVKYHSHASKRSLLSLVTSKLHGMSLQLFKTNSLSLHNLGNIWSSPYYFQVQFLYINKNWHVDYSLSWHFVFTKKKFPSPQWSYNNITWDVSYSKGILTFWFFFETLTQFTLHVIHWQLYTDTWTWAVASYS